MRVKKNGVFSRIEAIPVYFSIILLERVEINFSGEATLNFRDLTRVQKHSSASPLESYESFFIVIKSPQVDRTRSLQNLFKEDSLEMAFI